MKMRIILVLLGVLGRQWLVAQLPEGVSSTDSIAFARNIYIADTLASIAQWADWQVNSATQVYAQKTLRLVAQINQDAVSALLDRDAAQTAYNNAKADTTTTKEILNILKVQAANTKKQAKMATERRKSAAQLNELAEKAINYPAKQQRKQLPKTYADWKKMNDFYQSAPSPSTVTEKNTRRIRSKAKEQPTPKDDSPTVEDGAVIHVPSDSSKLDQPKTKKNKTKTSPIPKYTRYAIEEDVLITPPSSNCSMAVERRDAFSGAIYRETHTAEIFRFTNEYMRKVIPEGQSHITCQAALANDGANGTTLFLTFSIKDASARRVFGGLPKGAKANLRFLDGQVIWLENIKNSDGDLQADQTTFTFKGHYPLEKTILKRLATNELDQIRIAWGSGYEDYNVQQVHVLMEMAECLLK
jgi:hypothetical protein